MRNTTGLRWGFAVVGAILLTVAPGRAQQPMGGAGGIEHRLHLPVAPAETLHVAVAGTGPTVVLLPGLFGSAFSFRKVAPPLASSGHQVVVVDPLGIGASSRPGGADYSLEAQARRVAAALDSLGVSAAVVVAHSVGASMALRLALRRPSLVRGIVSLEGGIAEAAGTPGLRRALSMASVLGLFGLEGVVPGKLRERFRETSGDASWVTDQAMEGYLAPFGDDYDRAIDTYKAIAAAPEPRPLASRLDRVRVPVVLLLGTAPHDGGVPDVQLAVMKEKLACLEVVEVAGAGLWLHEERPGAVVEAVRRLLGGTAAAERPPS